MASCRRDCQGSGASVKAGKESSPLVSSRQASWLLLRQPDSLTAEERETVMALRKLHPDIELAYDFVQEFVQMLRTRTLQLDSYGEISTGCGLHANNFATSSQ